MFCGKCAEICTLILFHYTSLHPLNRSPVSHRLPGIFSLWSIQYAVEMRIKWMSLLEMRSQSYIHSLPPHSKANAFYWKSQRSNDFTFSTEFALKLLSTPGKEETRSQHNKYVYFVKTSPTISGLGSIEINSKLATHFSTWVHFRDFLINKNTTDLIVSLRANDTKLDGKPPSLLQCDNVAWSVFVLYLACDLYFRLFWSECAPFISLSPSLSAVDLKLGQSGMKFLWKPRERLI